MTVAWPVEIRLLKDRRALQVSFDDGRIFNLPAELLRVTSPSAEVQGHSEAERKTVGGKRNVTILSAIIVRREFGARSFGTVFGFASTIIQLATALGPSFYGVLREASSSYQLPLLIAAALDVVAAVIVWSGRVSQTARIAKSPSVH